MAYKSIQLEKKLSFGIKRYHWYK